MIRNASDVVSRQGHEEKVRKDDHARFDELSRVTYKKVYNLAYKLVGSRADAEDLTQEAYFRAYRGFDTYHGERPFENWVLRIVQRLFLDFLRTRRRRVKTVSYDAPLSADDSDSRVFFEKGDDSANPEKILLEAEIGPELQAAMAELTNNQRAIVQMADIEQASYKEIADRLDVPIGTIRSRLHRAHRALRSKLTLTDQGIAFKLGQCATHKA